LAKAKKVGGKNLQQKEEFRKKKNRGCDDEIPLWRGGKKKKPHLKKKKTKQKKLEHRTNSADLKKGAAGGHLKPNVGGKKTEERKVGSIPGPLGF